MKLLHSSDILVGLDFPAAGGHAERLRQARLEALRNLLELASREQVDVVLLAGNTLADNGLDQSEVVELARILGTSPAPLYLLPGLRDPYNPHSPYRLHADLFAPPVHILTEPTPVSLAQATLYPCLDSSSDPTAWIPGRDASGTCRIALACLPTSSGLPMDLAARRELDYVALGGSTSPSQSGLALWSGSPEATIWEEGPGQANLVTLTAGPPQVQRVATGRFTWLSWERVVADVEELARELSSITAPDAVLLRLALRGRLPRPALRRLEQLLEQQRAAFFDLQLDHRVGRIPESYIHPLLRVMERRILARSGDPLEAERALLYLERLAQSSPHGELV